MSSTYKDAGVDIDKQNRTVKKIAELIKKTHTPGVLGNIGHFGSFFAPDLSGYTSPVLVSSIDGVGTKTDVAVQTGKWEGIGEDIVNHCVNDILCSGAVPLYILDYFAASSLDPEVLLSIVKGMTRACVDAGCALVGGETAEMPGIYNVGKIDLAGCIVGVVERNKVISGRTIRKDDVLLALESSGLHTNGHTLARAALLATLSVHDMPEELGGRSVGDALLEPHRSYLTAVQAVLREVRPTGLAHITGGGLVENLSRLLPDGLESQIDWSAWELPALFRLIQTKGNVSDDEMRRTFNIGVGFVLVLKPEDAQRASSILSANGAKSFRIGTVQLVSET